MTDEDVTAELTDDLRRINVLASVLKGNEGSLPFAFWQALAHRLLSNPDAMLAIFDGGTRWQGLATADRGAVVFGRTQQEADDAQ